MIYLTLCLAGLISPKQALLGWLGERSEWVTKWIERNEE
jgi:hypothetical protein